jgi:hypothetical protein
MVGGGGTQPEDVLPASTVVYADIDLDPAAGQKLNLVRLLGRFPDVEDEYGPEPDLRELFVDALTKDTELEGVGVEDWIGDRLGVGVAWDPDANAVTPVAAIATSDEDAAVEDLRTVLDDDQVAATNGYVIVTGDVADLGADADMSGSTAAQPTSQTAADIASAGEDAPLSEATPFTEAFDRLDEGLATFYVDGEGMAEAGEQLSSSMDLDEADLADPLATLAEAGPSAAVLRADPDAIELVGWSGVDPPTGVTPASLVSGLPASTLFALEFTGGSDYVAEQWTKVVDSASGSIPPRKLDRTLAQIEAQTGLRLPEDLQTLFGQDVVLAVDSEGLLTAVPGMGLRSVTDPEAAADLANRLERALAVWTGGFGITAEGIDDGMVIASTPEYADQLVSGDGELGQSSAFRRAVPDAANATYVVWLDFAAISGSLALAEPDAADVIAPLQGFGLGVTPDDGGTTVRARLIFEDDDS